MDLVDSQIARQRHRHGPLEGGRLYRGLRRPDRPLAQFRAGVDERREGLGLEDRYQAESLDPEAEAGLELTIFMKVSFLVLLSTATPFPVPLPATRIFMPKLLKVAQPAAFPMAALALGWAL